MEDFCWVTDLSHASSGEGTSFAEDDDASFAGYVAFHKVLSSSQPLFRLLIKNRSPSDGDCLTAEAAAPHQI